MVESSTWSDDVDIKEKRVSMKLPGIGIYTSFQQQVRRLVTMSLGLSWARRWKNFFCPQLFSRLSPLPLVSSIFTVLLTIWFVIHLTFWSVLPGSQVGSSIFNLPVPDIFALILPSAYVSSPQYCGYVDFFHCPLLFIHDLPSIKFFHFFYDIKSLKGENSWFLLGSLQEVPFVGVPIQEVMVEKKKFSFYPWSWPCHHFSLILDIQISTAHSSWPRKSSLMLRRFTCCLLSHYLIPWCKATK